jgi:hypothetical protein
MPISKRVMVYRGESRIFNCVSTQYSSLMQSRSCKKRCNDLGIVDDNFGAIDEMTRRDDAVVQFAKSIDMKYILYEIRCNIAVMLVITFGISVQ